MKKNIIFLIVTIVFLMLPMNVKAYKICSYENGKSHIVLHVVGDNVQADYYNPDILTAITGGIINQPGFSKTTTLPLSAIKPSDLDGKCPNTTIKYVYIKDGDVIRDIGYPSNCGDAPGACYNFTYKEFLTEEDPGILNIEKMFEFIGGTGQISYSTTLNGGCPSDVGAFKLLGICYGLLKIGTPIFLVVFASIDLAKAVTSQDEGQIKKAKSACVKRVEAAVIVFLIFAIMEMLLGVVSNGSDTLGCIRSILK